MKANRFIFIGIVIFLVILVYSCSFLSFVFPPRTNTIDTFSDQVISDIQPKTTTNIFSSEELKSNLLSYDANSGIVILKKGLPQGKSASDLKPGNSILGGVTDLSPEGFLRKINEINETDDKIILNTEKNTISDAFDDFNISLTTGLGEDEISKAKLAEGVKYVSLQPKETKRAIGGIGEEKSLTICEIKFTFQKQEIINGVNVSIEGSFSWVPIIDVNLDIISQKFDFTLSSVTNLNLVSALDIKPEPFTASIPIIQDIKKTITVGVVPITININLSLDLSGNAATQLTAGIHAKSTSVGGIIYDYKNNKTEFKYDNSDKQAEPYINAAFSGNLKAYLGPSVSIKIADVIGPFIQLKPLLSASGEASLPLSLMSSDMSSQISMDWGLLFQIGGKIEFFKINAEVEYEKEYIIGNIYNKSIHSNLPKCEMPTIDINNANGSEISVTLSKKSPNYIIMYTLDNTDPTNTNGKMYINPFKVQSPCTIKARAFMLGMAPSTISSKSIENNTPLQPGTIRFQSDSYTVNENAGWIKVYVSRKNGSDGDVSISYATSNGTATAGSDYTSKAGILSWKNGDIDSKEILIPIIDDSVYEGNESFTITLSDVKGGASIGSPNTTTVMIIDNETNNIADLKIYNLNYSRPTPDDTYTRGFRSCDFEIFNYGPLELNNKDLKINFYFSKNSTYGDSDDIKIGDVVINVSIKSGQSKKIYLSETGLKNMVKLWKPGFINTNEYNLFASLQYLDNSIIDSNTNNNYCKAPNKVYYVLELRLRYAYNNSDVPVGDLNSNSSLILINDCPSESVIVSVTVKFEIKHPHANDLDVWLTCYYNNNYHACYLIKHGKLGNQRDISMEFANIHTWDGASPNQKWYLCVEDFYAGNVGYIDRFEIVIYYYD